MTQSSQRSLVVGLILLGILTAVFFGVRSLLSIRELRETVPGPPTPLILILTEQPYETDVEMIRGWMTIPYIAKTFQVDPVILFDALGIPTQGYEEKNLDELNEEFFSKERGKVIILIKSAVLKHMPSPSAVP